MINNGQLSNAASVAAILSDMDHVSMHTIEVHYSAPCARRTQTSAAASYKFYSYPLRIAAAHFKVRTFGRGCHLLQALAWLPRHR